VEGRAVRSSFALCFCAHLVHHTAILMLTGRSAAVVTRGRAWASLFRFLRTSNVRGQESYRGFRGEVPRNQSSSAADLGSVRHVRQEFRQWAASSPPCIVLVCSDSQTVVRRWWRRGGEWPTTFEKRTFVGVFERLPTRRAAPTRPPPVASSDMRGTE
jgi:hypothetical protein